MNKKAAVKMCIDLVMTAALPVLMCYSIVGETAHEVIGVAMFCLFIAHHILNFGWIRSLFKGRYDLHRSVNTAVNALVFLCMIGLSDLMLRELQAEEQDETPQELTMKESTDEEPSIGIA